MTALEVFSTGNWSVRTELRDGDPWFVARDVCEALGLDNTSRAVERLNGDGVSSAQVIDSLGRTQTATVVDEGALYELIFQSRRPEAAKFRRWVTRDVLPAIRKTGQYGQAPALPTYSEALRQLAAELDHRAILEAKVAEDAPKVELAEAVLSADGDLSLREAAQALARDHGIVTGQNRLMEYIRQLGWVDRLGHPYQRYVEQGVVAVRVRTYDHPHTGEPQMSTQVRITPKGLSQLHQRLAVAS